MGPTGRPYDPSQDRQRGMKNCRRIRGEERVYERWIGARSEENFCFIDCVQTSNASCRPNNSNSESYHVKVKIKQMI